MAEILLDDDRKGKLLKAASRSKKVREVLPMLGIDLEQLKKEVKREVPERLSDEEIKSRLAEHLKSVENPEKIADADRFTYWIWESALDGGRRRIVVAQLVGASGVPVKALSIPVEIARDVADAILRKIGNKGRKR